MAEAGVTPADAFLVVDRITSGSVSFPELPGHVWYLYLPESGRYQSCGLIYPRFFRDASCKLSYPLYTSFARGRCLTYIGTEGKHIGVSWLTARRTLKKIRTAMGHRDSIYRIENLIEFDDTYAGGI